MIDVDEFLSDEQLERLRSFLGHASAETTARYVRSGAAENAAVVECVFDQ
ncbi:hypothetical protein ACFSKW_29380 [Nonomuraea mangrovi]|uniref:Integrase n=1 Tax=Nonomuraea mangrovi TaxID=2316207 RepID=A0ABW4T2X0_9ACTN